MYKTKPLDHLVLILGSLFLVLPVIVAFMTSPIPQPKST